MTFLIKRRGLKALNGGGKNELTTAMFLGKVGDTTYIKPESIIDFVDKGRVEDIEGVDNYFKYSGQKVRMGYNGNVRTDAGGLDYLYLTFYRRNAIEGVKVVLIDNMKQFIEDFSNGKFTINFTLEDLVAEAEQG